MFVDFEFKENYLFEDLVCIMKCLRSENGCPWDAEQTHESIKKNFIEETYEVIEAINKKDNALLCEELGDVLLQIVFHAQIENEKDVFSINDVTDGICKKLIERHPHVFGETNVNSVEDVLNNWDSIKRKSKEQKTQSEAMEHVPLELPALMRSTKIQQKAAKAGFDWESTDEVLKKLDEEILELKTAILQNNSDNIFEELGDVLFSVVNLSRFVDCDSEEALTASTNKFISRYKFVEQIAEKNGVDLKNATIKQLDEIWNEAKKMLIK